MLCILHTDPEDRSVFCQRFMQEQLYSSISKDHPLAKTKSVTFDDLRGLRILVNGNVGFWLAICKLYNAGDHKSHNALCTT